MFVKLDNQYVNILLITHIEVVGHEAVLYFQGGETLVVSGQDVHRVLLEVEDDLR